MSVTLRYEGENGICILQSFCVSGGEGDIKCDFLCEKSLKQVFYKEKLRKHIGNFFVR